MSSPLDLDPERFFPADSGVRPVAARLFAVVERLPILFRGTPSRLWLDHVFADVFDLRERLDRDSADRYFNAINAALGTAPFKPRAWRHGDRSRASHGAHRRFNARRRPGFVHAPTIGFDRAFGH